MSKILSRVEYGNLLGGCMSARLSTADANTLDDHDAAQREEIRALRKALRMAVDAYIEVPSESVPAYVRDLLRRARRGKR